MEEHRGPLRTLVDAVDDGATVRILAERIIGIDETALALLHGGIWLGRRRARGDELATAGDELTISRPPSGAYATVVFDSAWVLFEDADLLAVDKPAGVYVEATPWDTGGHLRGAVEAFLTKRDGQLEHLHLAHRLDRDTSGVLLFSKNEAINPALQASFANGQVHKRYLCRCAGEPANDHFSLHTGHGRGARGQFRVYPLEDVGKVLPGGSTVKQMETGFTVLRRDGDSALLSAEPLTGRTHQIRLHAAAAGFPLLGDVRYGGPTEWRGVELGGHLLHAASLHLAHPRTGEALLIEARPVGWVEG